MRKNSNGVSGNFCSRSIHYQQRNYKFDIDCIKQKCKEELEPSEKEWRSNATKWLNIAGRKVTVKSAEAGNKWNSQFFNGYTRMIAYFCFKAPSLVNLLSFVYIILL